MNGSTPIPAVGRRVDIVQYDAKKGQSPSLQPNDDISVRRNRDIIRCSNIHCAIHENCENMPPLELRNRLSLMPIPSLNSKQHDIRTCNVPIISKCNGSVF